jgi:FkbM family methyltransferase
MHYDNIEIGTSDFRTLCESAQGNGISVEPIPYYFNRLRKRPDWNYLRVAVSNRSGTATVYHCDPDKLDLYPNWIRGCNSIDHVHPTLKIMCKHIITTEVKVITPAELYDLLDVTEIGLLKIDTEGHDCTIINSMLDDNLPLPDTLRFESNELTPKSEYNALLRRLAPYYGRIYRDRFDTVCINKAPVSS